MLQRRDFLKTSLASVGVILSGAAPVLADSAASTPSSGKARVESGHLQLEFDLGTGRFDLRSTHGDPLLVQATSAIAVGREIVLVSDDRYMRSARTGNCDTSGVAGKQLIVTCKDQKGALDLEITFTMLEDRLGAVFEIVATNVSAKPISIPYLEPIRAIFSDEAGLNFGTYNLHSDRVLTNGYLYLDPGHLLDSMAYTHQDFTSWWNAAIHNPKSKDTLVVGHLDNRDTEGVIIGGWDAFRGSPMQQATMNLTARSLLFQRFMLQPGAKVPSGRVIVLRSKDPFATLEDYASTCGKVNQVKLNPIINGWNSWFYTMHKTSEAEQIRNAEFIAKNLKSYGMEWVQIDEGYSRAYGDWEANNRFPKGMKWLAGRIKELGLKAGIWLAPFLINKDIELAKAHPEWMVRNVDGSLFLSRSDYVLDITVPAAREWFFNLFKTIAEDWGYDFIKIDFVERSILAAPKLHDPAMTRAQAYRLGMETIRKAIGPKRHLLDCGPANETIGICDSTRIELDLAELKWPQFVKNFNSTAPAMAKRYYFHNRTWINDADHFGVKLMTIPQAQSAATLIGLSGGTTISGDPLPDLNEEQLSIVKKALPAFGQAARPIDLFETDYPEIFSLPIQKGSEKWQLVRYFNYDETAQCDKELALDRLDLNAKKTYLAFEFWTQKFLGEVTHTLPLHFGPSQVNLVALREKSGTPQVLGTDRHYTQGAIELDKITWDASAQALSGLALGAPGMKWNVSIFVPPDYLVDATEKGGHWTASQEGNVLRVQCDFQNVSQIGWSIRFKKR